MLIIETFVGEFSWEERSGGIGEEIYGNSICMAFLRPLHQGSLKALGSKLSKRRALFRFMDLRSIENDSDKMFSSVWMNTELCVGLVQVRKIHRVNFWIFL